MSFTRALNKYFRWGPILDQKLSLVAIENTQTCIRMLLFHLWAEASVTSVHKLNNNILMHVWVFSMATKTQTLV